jgi:hypothetical protein
MKPLAYKHKIPPVLRTHLRWYRIPASTATRLHPTIMFLHLIVHIPLAHIATEIGMSQKRMYRLSTGRGARIRHAEIKRLQILCRMAAEEIGRSRTYYNHRLPLHAHYDEILRTQQNLARYLARLDRKPVT